MGQDVTYSGTVAAAKEGRLPRNPLHLRLHKRPRRHFLFRDAAEITGGDSQRWWWTGRPPEGTFLNVNIPNVARARISGFMVTRLGKRIYNDNVTVRTDPRGTRRTTGSVETGRDTNPSKAPILAR